MLDESERNIAIFGTAAITISCVGSVLTGYPPIVFFFLATFVLSICSSLLFAIFVFVIFIFYTYRQSGKSPFKFLFDDEHAFMTLVRSIGAPVDQDRKPDNS